MTQEQDLARLEGVALAAREMAHRLNNELSIVVGCLDLLHLDPELPAQCHQLVEKGQASLEAATAIIQKFQRVTRVETKETPAGPALDLERSSPPFVAGTSSDPDARSCA